MMTPQRHSLSFKRVSRPLCWLSGLLLVLAPSAVFSQTPSEIRISLRSPDGLPIGGALVELVDPSAGLIADGLSSESGMRVLRAPPGTYRVRVRRIGYVPFLSGVVKIPAEKAAILIVESSRISFAPILVWAKGVCGAPESGSDHLALVWEEVAKALHASELSAADLVGAATATVYRRQVRYGGAVLAADTTVFEIRNRRPFGTKDPAVLAREGYVRGGLLAGWTYFGPDQTSLLSDDFLSTHCFRLVSDKVRPREIGLAFEPSRDHKASDIKGVLWLDTTSFELRELVFRFTNTGILERFEAGGFTRFRRMPSGAWIVDAWYLRGPLLELRPGTADPVVPRGYIEDGGSIEMRAPATETHALADKIVERNGVLTGVVFDSVAETPLVNATIAMSGSSTQSEPTLTDASGRFKMVGVARGTFLVSFSHPTLEAYGVRAFERQLTLQSDSVSIVLATPSMRSEWRTLCPDSVNGAFVENRGIVHGYVNDETGKPVDGALVRMTWTQSRPTAVTAESIDRLQLTARTDNFGHYSACGFRRASIGRVTLAGNVKANLPRRFEFTQSLLVRRDLQPAH
jgi:hypothetical protein